jgi:hypothetical protein
MKTPTLKVRMKIKTVESEAPLFRDPSPQEIIEVYESLAAWVWDRQSRDLELVDHWERHCMEFAVSNFRKASAN